MRTCDRRQQGRAVTLPERWHALWQRLGASPPPGELEALLARYREPHRHYHTLAHLEDCLAELDAARSLCERPDEVELALWYHDAIYEPYSSGNEVRSADWAERSARAAGLPAEAAGRVHALILATRHDALPQTPDARVLTDIDLAILGAEPERFDRYERQVRAEYRWVPGPLYRRARRKILQDFLAREALYATPGFRTRLETSARANLTRALRAL